MSCVILVTPPLAVAWPALERLARAAVAGLRPDGSAPGRRASASLRLEDASIEGSGTTTLDLGETRVTLTAEGGGLRLEATSTTLGRDQLACLLGSLVGRLRQRHAYETALRALRARGYTVLAESVDAQGNIRLVLGAGAAASGIQGGVT